MTYILRAPKTISGSINLPSSKSISNRALILKALAGDETPIKNISDCDDTQVMLAAFDENNGDIINVKAAGTSMRFLTAYFSRTPGDRVMTGTTRMKQRPIHVLVNALRNLGADIAYMENEGFPPLRVKGKELEGGEISLSGGISSQFISALLMIAPTMSKGLKIKLEGNVISKPYIHLTLEMMKQFGVYPKWTDDIILVNHEDYKPTDYLVESDWSAASYWYAMMALSDQSEIFLEGLNEKSLQGDARVADLFEDLGVHTTYLDGGVQLTKSEIRIKKMFNNFESEPDLAQTFAVTCCMLGIPFLFTGLQTLKIKETDRIEALKVELRKLGYVLVDRDNSILEWDGERCTPDADPIIHTYDDHRMAMAFAPAAFKLEQLKIADPGVVSKSYPKFWKDLESVGFSIGKFSVTV